MRSEVFTAFQPASCLYMVLVVRQDKALAPKMDREVVGASDCRDCMAVEELRWDMVPAWVAHWDMLVLVQDNLESVVDMWTLDTASIPVHLECLDMELAGCRLKDNSHWVGLDTVDDIRMVLVVQSNLDIDLDNTPF